MKWSVFTIFLVLLASMIGIQSSAQIHYAYLFDATINEGYIYQFESTFDLTLVATLDESAPIFADISVTPDGQLYGLSQAGEINIIDLQNESVIPIVSYNEEGPHTAFVSDANYSCYTLNSWFNLFSYNLITEQEEFIVNLGEITPGDLGFYKGHIIYPSSDGFIKAVDPESFEVTSIYCLPPEIIEMKGIWGICNWFDACDEEYVLVVNTEEEFFLIDIEAGTFEAIDVTYDIQMEGQFYGMASINDTFASECHGAVTEDDCIPIGVVEHTPPNQQLFYPNPVEDVLTLNGIIDLQRIEIIDAMGSLTKVLYTPTSHLNVAFIQSGMYIVKCYFSDGSMREEKLVKM